MTCDAAGVGSRRRRSPRRAMRWRLGTIVKPTVSRQPACENARDDYDATAAAAEARGYRDAARHLGIEPVERAVRTQGQAHTTLAQLHKVEVDRILKPRSLSLNISGFILEAAVQRAIPATFDGAF